MNRPLFIIIGSVVILVLLLVWVYVLFIRGNFTEDNNTGSSGTFSNLDLEDTSLDSNSNDSNQDDDTLLSSTTVTGERKKLRQLTTKRVAGFSEINASTTDVAYFIEAGVGHMYEVDIFTGQERRISATTFPDTYSGDITTDGKHFVLQTGYSNNRATHVGNIDTETQATTNTRQLEAGVVSHNFFENESIGYAVAGTNNVTIRSYDFETETSKTIFTIPFREASIVWGKNEQGPHYFFPKSASGLEGFVYEYSEGNMRRLPLDGFNLSAYGSEDIALATFVENSKFQTSIYQRKDNISTTLNQPLLPHKCLQTSDLALICGIDINTRLEESHFTIWQQGRLQFSDDINLIDQTNGASTELANTKAITGRVVDITKMEQGMKYGFVYFINKNDQTLWIYEYESTTVSDTETEVE